MVARSHARCKKCGQARHRSARFNLCQKCWQQAKPGVREQWQAIKTRRAARRDREELVSSNGIVSLADLFEQIRKGELPEEQTKAAIARIRAEGVRTLSTQDRATYMRLFKGLPKAAQAPAESELTRADTRVTSTAAPEVAPEVAPERDRRGRPRRYPALSAEREAEVVRLYQDRSVPVTEIEQAYGLTTAVLYRLLQRHGIPTRLRGTPPAATHPSAPTAAPTNSRARSWDIVFSATFTVGAESFEEAVRAFRQQYPGAAIEQVSGRAE